jgi:hypothetical protein
MLKKLATAVAVIALAVTTAPPAAQAEPREPTCRGFNCDGVSPMAVDCYRDAISLEGTRGYWMQFTYVIRYSPTCQSAWALIDRGPVIGGGLEVTSYWADWSYRMTVSNFRPEPGAAYTPMVYAGYVDQFWGLWTEACFSTTCTSFYSIS